MGIYLNDLRWFNDHCCFLWHPYFSDHNAHFRCDLSLYHVALNANVLTHAIVVLAFIFQTNKVK